MVQLKVNMNQNPTQGKSQEHHLATARVLEIHVDDIEANLDYRDPETVWIWIADNVCIELSRSDAEMIGIGFAQE
jgi:hypothetical protein